MTFTTSIDGNIEIFQLIQMGIETPPRLTPQVKYAFLNDVYLRFIKRDYSMSQNTNNQRENR